MKSIIIYIDDKPTGIIMMNQIKSFWLQDKDIMIEYRKEPAYLGYNNGVDAERDFNKIITAIVNQSDNSVILRPFTLEN
jgi:hypothetical protein